MFQEWLNDWYSSGIEAGADGKASNKGLGGLILQNVVDEESLKNKKQRNLNRSVTEGIPFSKLEGYNDTWSTLQTQDALFNYRENKEKADRERVEGREDSLIAAGNTVPLAQLEMTRESNETARTDSNNQFRLQYERLLQQDKRADQARIDDLEYRRMRDRKEDQRYNEGLDRADRKDRRASIQTLVAGLANLGAAFAL